MSDQPLTFFWCTCCITLRTGLCQTPRTRSTTVRYWRLSGSLCEFLVITLKRRAASAVSICHAPALLCCAGPCYQWHFQENPRFSNEKPRKTRIIKNEFKCNYVPITNLDIFEVYTNTVFWSVLVKLNAVSDFDFLNVQWMTTDVLVCVWWVIWRSVRRRGKNVDSSSKSNPLRRRGKKLWLVDVKA